MLVAADVIMNFENFPTGFAPAELIMNIRLRTGRRVPHSTLRYWRSCLYFETSQSGLYTKKQLEVLVALALWLQRGSKIGPFITQFKPQIIEAIQDAKGNTRSQECCR